MHNHVEKYVEDLVRILREILFGEFDSLKDKHTFFKNEDYINFDKVIELQKLGISNLKRHFSNFNEHEEFIKRSILDRDNLNEFEHSRFDDLIKRDDFSIRFFLGHMDKFYEIICKQEELIKIVKKNKASFIEKAVEKVKHKLKLDLIGKLEE